MKTPIRYRKDIPFFYDKNEIDFQKDVYERYEGMVLRHAAFHLADDIWGKYPKQAIFDFSKAHYPNIENPHILEIGTGVGRWIAALAQAYPGATCWGIDYSYQMLKMAHDYWKEGKEFLFDLRDRGFSQTINVQGHQLNNLQFGLAKAENLPFNDNSQDLIVNSFLLDRLEDPTQGLVEMYRVLKPKGKLILITPLNFNKAKHWETYYPPIKLFHILNQIGFDILQWEEEMILQESLDFHGNLTEWKCIGFVANKLN